MSAIGGLPLESGWASLNSHVRTGAEMHNLFKPSRYESAAIAYRLLLFGPDAKQLARFAEFPLGGGGAVEGEFIFLCVR